MTKNVIDYYQDWYDEDITADLMPSRLPLKIACESVNGDFHKANILRTAEGFNLEAFYLIGDKRWDRRGAVGAHHRLIPTVIDDLQQLKVAEPTARFVAVDNVYSAKSIYNYIWQDNTVMIFGEEQRGLSQEAIDMADDIVYVPMRGAVRSFSVSTAAGMLIFDYVKHYLGRHGV